MNSVAGQAPLPVDAVAAARLPAHGGAAAGAAAEVLKAAASVEGTDVLDISRLAPEP